MKSKSTSVSWDAIYKQAFVALFKQLGISLVTEYEAGRLPLRIDAVAVCGAKDRKKLALYTPFNFFRTHNLIEVKSHRDPLSLGEFHRILARGHLYFSDHDLTDADDLLICIITASRPRKLLSLKPEKGGLVILQPGLYENTTGLKCYVIVASELEIKERNYPLLLLSKGRKRREYSQALIANREVEYIHYAYLLYPGEVEEALKMSKIKESYDIRANLRYIVNSVGWKALIESTGPEETENLAEAFVESAKAREVESLIRILVDQLGPEKVEGLMKALVDQLGPEKAEEMWDRVKPDGHSRRHKRNKKQTQKAKK